MKVPMKFKCNTSGCVYSFESPLDIASMLKSQDYTALPDESAPKEALAPLTSAPAEPVEEVVPGPDAPATIAPVAQVKTAPNKPLPTVHVAPKAV